MLKSSQTPIPARKVIDLDVYNANLEKLEADKALVDSR